MVVLGPSAAHFSSIDHLCLISELITLHRTLAADKSILDIYQSRAAQASGGHIHPWLLPLQLFDDVDSVSCFWAD